MGCLPSIGLDAPISFASNDALQSRYKLHSNVFTARVDKVTGEAGAPSPDGDGGELTSEAEHSLFSATVDKAGVTSLQFL